MNLYLSSYNLGNELSKLREMIKKTNGKFAYISNAMDFTDVDEQRLAERIKFNINELQEQGEAIGQKLEIEQLDLKDYFHKPAELEKKLETLGGVYVSGGNTFVLRQAMKLSGFDEILPKILQRNDFLYIGYSAGVCVLSPDLKVIAMTDNAEDFPYPDLNEQIWEGLGILDFVFEPHYKSDHDESESTDKEIQYCIENKILFKAYRDGEVLIIEE